MPIRWLDKVRTAPQIELAPEPPRTVGQQARMLQAHPPFVRRDVCQICASHKLIVGCFTMWRHTFRICEECLDMLHEVLIKHDA